MVRGVLLSGFVLASVACSTKANPVYCDAATGCPENYACAVDKHVCVDDAFTLNTDDALLQDGTLWFASAAPVLKGTYEDAQAPVLEVLVDEAPVSVAPKAAGGAWSLAMPEGALRDGAVLALRMQAEDGTVEIRHKVGIDAAPPAAVVAPLEFADEARDVVTFAADGTPTHTHVAREQRVADERCGLSIAKYAYLLDTTPPAGAEVNGAGVAMPNPLTLRMKIASKVHADAQASTYRLLDSAGREVIAATAMADAMLRVEGGYEFGLPLTRQVAPALGKASDKYTLELNVVDWAGRKAQGKLCWQHRVLPTPVRVSELRAVPMTRSLADVMQAGGLALYEADVDAATTEPVELQLVLPAVELQATRTVRQVGFSQVERTFDRITGDTCRPVCDLIPRHNGDTRSAPMVTRHAITVEAKLTNGQQTIACNAGNGYVSCLLPPRGSANRYTLQISTCAACNLGALNPTGRAPGLLPYGTGATETWSGCMNVATRRMQGCNPGNPPGPGGPRPPVEPALCEEAYCSETGSSKLHTTLVDVRLEMLAAGAGAAPQFVPRTAIPGGTAAPVTVPARPMLAVPWAWAGQ